PVAAGLGGGSADAAALLRLARDEVEGLAEVASELGADVPSQLEPRFALVGGTGEVVEPLPAPAHFGVVLVPSDEGLATADVYAEADRLGLGREREGLEAAAGGVREAAPGGAAPVGGCTYVRGGAAAFLEAGACVGRVLPGETVVILGGAVAGQGETSIVLTIGVVWAAAFAGDSVSFLLGRRLGRGFILRHG